MSETRAVVIGGGLAGLTVAKELRKRGLEVVILEATARLGGKAGADRIDGRYIEHGYHVFPGWYLNVRALLAELGVETDLIDLDRFHVLKAGEFPRFYTFYQMSPPWNALRNMLSGIMPWPQIMLTYYCVLDLQSQSFSYRDYLDRISVNGFLFSRFYTSEAMAEFQQQSALQASSIPNYELSTMSSQKVMRAWMGTPAPLFSILNGNLQEKFIVPFEKLVRKLGVEIHTNCRVQKLIMKNGRVTGLVFDGVPPPIRFRPDDFFVITTPPEVTLTFVDPAVYAAEDRSTRDAERLADIVKLESAPMAALDLYLRRTLAHIPREHVMLQGSRYALSFIDVSQHWPDLKHTALSIIAADFEFLRQLPDEDRTKYLVAELQRYIPTLRKEDVAQSYLRPNVDSPLFLNTVGSWPFRPGTRTRIRNLYTAGDYCKSEADLTTMESAIISALNTVTAILSDVGAEGYQGPIPLKLIPRWIAGMLKYAAFPLILPFGISNWVARYLGTPDESGRWTQDPQGAVCNSGLTHGPREPQRESRRELADFDRPAARNRPRRTRLRQRQ